MYAANSLPVPLRFPYQPVLHWPIPAAFDTLVEEMRHSFMRGNSRSLKVRKANLMAMRQMLQTHEDEFLAALKVWHVHPM